MATTGPTSSIPTWALWLGLGVAAWMTYDAVAPMVSARRAPRRLSGAKARPRGGYYVVYDAPDDPDARGGKQRRHFATRADAQEWISDQLSPSRHPRIVPA